ncbi:MAG: helix-turn-helix transcriptional regulator [Mailhella sp.]|nr:helix-turn-helix transcriptional regulator [Mailhella sp.]
MNIMKKRRLQGVIPTQNEVAKILGVVPSAVSKWERGLAKPRADKLVEIAKLYGCTVDELLVDETGDDDEEDA